MPDGRLRRSFRHFLSAKIQAQYTERNKLFQKIFAVSVNILFLCSSFVLLHIENVIKKGGETRLCETLATLRQRRRCYILFALVRKR